MASRLKSLFDLLTSEPVCPKVLVCRSHAEGHQWLERIGTEYGPVLNVSVGTVESVVLDLATLGMEEAGLSYLSGESLTWLTHALLLDIAASDRSLVEESLLSPGFVRVFRDALTDLRNAGVNASELQDSAFENAGKGRLVKQLLQSYESYLERNRLADYSVAAECAMKELEQSETSPSPSTMYILPKSLQLDAVSERFLSQLAKIHRVEWWDDTVPEDHPFLPNTAAVQLFCAAGTVAEAREVFRRILAIGGFLDEVEIVATTEEEALAVYAVSQQLGVPVRFRNGLPAHITGLGQLAYVFLDWLESGYHITHLIGAVQQGILRIPSESTSNAEFVRALRKARIGWGRDRYLTVLNRKLEKSSLEHPERAEAYRQLYQNFSDLLARLPDQAMYTVSELLSALDFFLTRFGRIKDERDGQVLAQIRELRDSFGGVPSVSLDKRQVLQYARQILDSVRVDAWPRPEPGAVYVSNLDSGGLTGRPHVFVMGMSETNWSTSTTQDPILLDEERTAIHPSLKTTVDKLKHTLNERRRFFYGLSGRVTFSYSAYDPLENRTEAPAPELLTIYREHLGEQDADYSDLVRALGEPIGYAGRVDEDATGAGPLDEVDLWIRETMDSGGLFRDGMEALLRAYPWLQRGSEAEAARASDGLTEFDGLVDTSHGSIQRTHYAPTALETLAGCPRKYLYQRLLGLAPPEEAEFNRSEWLNPADRGALYHEIFRIYIGEIASGRAPDEARLMAICDDVLSRYREEVPGPSRHVVELECEQIRQSMRKFYQLEQSRQGKPRFVEQEIGEVDNPFAVDLGGLVLPIYGKVDRIDEIGPHTYQVVDYKTGSDFGYSQNDYFKGGQHLQHALYAIAVEQWLKATDKDREARVTEGAYVFPTLRARREEVRYRQDRREDVRRLVSHMLSVLENGVFVATQDEGACSYCDFLSICTKQSARQSKEKRNNPDNAARLADLLEVESFA